jgi:hypothetical protein
VDQRLLHPRLLRLAALPAKPLIPSRLRRGGHYAHAMADEHGQPLDGFAVSIAPEG